MMPIRYVRVEHNAGRIRDRLHFACKTQHRRIEAGWDIGHKWGQAQVWGKGLENNEKGAMPRGGSCRRRRLECAGPCELWGGLTDAFSCGVSGSEYAPIKGRGRGNVGRGALRAPHPLRKAPSPWETAPLWGRRLGDGGWGFTPRLPICFLKRGCPSLSLSGEDDF